MSTWDAKSYIQSTQWQRKLNQAFISAHPFNGDESILDIGCGDGQLAYFLAKLVPRGQVIGIDHSENMINHAINKFKHHNLEFIQMDAEKLFFPQKFNVIVSTFCIHWIANKKNIFQRIAMHLKKNGHIQLLMPFDNPHLSNIRKKLMQDSEWSIYFKNRIDPQDIVLDNNYKEYALQAGFTNIRYHQEFTSIRYENITALFNILKNITAALSFLPTEELKTKFTHQMIENYITLYPQASDGSCQVTCSYATLKAGLGRLSRYKSFFSGFQILGARNDILSA